MDLQPDAVPERVHELLAAPRGDDDAARGRVDVGHLDARAERGPARGLRGGDQRVQLALPVRRGRPSTTVRVMSEW